MNVMVVDDDLFSLHVLQIQLGHQSVSSVSSFSSARNALTKLKEKPESIDLVVCDLQMPDMDGIEFIRGLAEVEFSNSVAIISGETQRIRESAVHLAQVLGLRTLPSLGKPINESDIAQLIRIAQSGMVPRARNTDHSEKPTIDISEAEVQAAMTGDQLVSFYQPKVDLSSGDVSGVESLIRWRHPEHGLLTPDKFLGAVNRFGLMLEMTDWVLKQSLKDAHYWGNLDEDAHVAINISSDSLADVDFPDNVIAMASEFEVNPNRIVFEVTEHKVIDGLKESWDTLTRLRLKRIGLSVDDFGTGYSSLALLRDVPFNELKVDRGFIHNAHSLRERGAIVEASVAIARELNMEVVAEGVEDKADWIYARSVGCNIAQGYFIGKPMPPEQLSDWSTDWKERVRVNEIFAHSMAC